jgi:predicted small metal-binding protein
MFEYVCERLVPGCSHRETADTPEAVREKALKHLHEHDGMEYIDGGSTSHVDDVIVPSQAR